MAHAREARPAGALSAGRHRRRSARRHEPLRDRRAERDRGARGVRARAACCTRPTSTWRSWSSARARRTRVSLDAPVHENLQGDRRAASGRSVEDLVVIVLDRPRHEKLIDDIRATGARIRLIGDGDLSAGIAAAVVGTGVHAVMGTGGAPEGVLTAAAMRCLNGEIFARLVVSKPEHEERCRAMGITDFKKIYRSKDLAPGERHHLRRDRRHRRHADERRPLLRRRHPHQLGRSCRTIRTGSASSTASTSSRTADGQDSLLTCRSHTRERTGGATSSRSPPRRFIGFTGFTLVMPFLPLFIRQLGVDRRRARSRCGPG